MIKILKKLKYYYTVLYNEVEYNIEKEIIYKYQIKNNMEITNFEFDKILEENAFYYYDRFSKNKLRKMLTTFELKELLIKEGANIDIINQLINNYLNFNYLNDDYYIKTYLEFKSNKEGPKLIKTKLIKKGLDEKLIDKYLLSIKEELIISNNINNLINKYKNLNKSQLNQKIKTYLINKGFNYSLVNDLVNKALESISIDETKLIEKDFNKLLKKYQNKFSGYELKQILIQKLYSKGYNLNNINNIVNNCLL